MPYDASEIDYVCTDCGYVKSGPHQGAHVQSGERVPHERGATTYKGAPISDLWGDACPECSKGKETEHEREMIKRYGRERYEQAKKDAQQNEQQRKERKVQHEAERAASTHWWWRKMGGK